MHGSRSVSRWSGLTGSRLSGALAVLVALAAIGLVAIVSLDPASMFVDDADAAMDVAATEQPAPANRPAGPRRIAANAAPLIQILNKGTVDSDPVRHDARVQELATAVAASGDAVTADDDLDPAGTTADWYPPQLKTYRTVCVRLCDGALTPISFSTTRDRLALDALRCRKSCGSPSKLYVQRNPAGDGTDLVDLDGRRYAALDTAFKFRTSYDNACTCRAHAWEGLAQSRHRLFEIQARLRAGRQIAHGRMTRLRIAAAKSARFAARQSHLVPVPVAVTGSVGMPSPAPDMLVATAERVDGDMAEAATELPAIMRIFRKGGKSRRGKAIAQANSKQVQGKPTNSVALLVLFGQPSAKVPAAGSNAVIAPRAYNNLLRADAATRRYDGNDWRISGYEPL